MQKVLIFRGGCDLTTNNPCLMKIQSCMARKYDAGICKHQKEHTGVIEIYEVTNGTDSMQNGTDSTSNDRGHRSVQNGGVADLNYPESKTRRGRVIENGEICPTLTTENIPNVIEDWVWEIDGTKYLIRIRKLTPRECWRLMDFSDEDFEKAQAAVSNTQLYKQAGNSIVKNVMCEVFKQLIESEG